MAVHLARQKRFPEFKRTGMDGRSYKIFVSKEAHYSFKKAVVALGIGLNQVVEVDVDESGRMDIRVLRHLLKQERKSGNEPLLVCATAGTTVMGAYDPIEGLAEVCREQDIWLHVDGAWGGAGLFSKKLRPLLKGIEHADSVSFDGHKLLGAAITCSFILTRHRGLLLAANDVAGGDYLFHDDVRIESLNRGQMSWQCGRGPDAVGLWAVWKNLGAEGIGDFVDRLLEVRDESLRWIAEQPRLQLVAEPQFLNVCVRILPPAGRAPDPNWSEQVRSQMRASQRAMVNYSKNSSGSFLRLILAHPELKANHVKDVLTWALEVT
jgi:glutamate/tyrosine decarboxylase-like PLP-dependent enzyme